MFRTLVGFVSAFILPLRWTTRLCLEQELKKFSIGSSKACIQEFADAIIRYARLMNKMSHKPVREEIVDACEGEAVLIADVLEGMEERPGTIESKISFGAMVTSHNGHSSPDDPRAIDADP